MWMLWAVEKFDLKMSWCMRGAEDAEDAAGLRGWRVINYE